MLGKKVAEMTAITANKMLPSNNGQPRFETSCDGTGTMLGVTRKCMATYWATINPDGSVYGECPDSGVVLTAEGPVTFRANGAGAFTEDGGAKFRGSAFFTTAVPSLAELNGMCLVHEWDVDGDGNATWQLWEWS